MPIQPCSKEGKPGYQYGDSGICYTDKDARAKAEAQRQAILASGYKENKVAGAPLLLNFPIQKVDKKQRVITGVATADNVDPEGDKIDFNASIQAFGDWVGNIREMHEPKAVGKAMNYKQVSVPYEGDIYNGIEVKAHISKGAEDTWQKILDGTLTGFSVGGKILDKTHYFDEDKNQPIRIIRKYELGELSLVDNPGNPAARINLVKRAGDGTLQWVLRKDYALYISRKEQDVYVDPTQDKIDANDLVLVGTVNELGADIVEKVITSTLVTNPAMEVKNTMDNLQNNDETDIVANMDLTPEQQDGVITKFKSVLFGNSTAGSYTTSSGLIPNINIYNHPDPVEKAASAVLEVEEDSIVSEDAMDDGGTEVDIEQITEVLSSLLDEKLTKVKSEISEDLDTKIEEKVEEIQKSVSDISEKVEATESSLEEVNDKVEQVEKSGAIKKSVDATDEDDTLEKSVETESFWGNKFVPKEVIEACGYSS
jgi:hypothetical protein